MRKNKPRKPAMYKILVLLLVVVIMAALIIFAVDAYSSHKHAAYSKFSILNINSSDIGFVIKNASYVPILLDNITEFTPYLRSEGYIASSVSLFNLSKNYNYSQFPDVITSAAFLMSNSSAATQALQSLIFSNNANQSVRGYVYNSTSSTNYAARGGNVTIYLVTSVSVFNASAINSTTRKYLSMPDYQYTSIFAKGNYTITLVVDSFNPEAIYGNYSLELAERLANKI